MVDLSQSIPASYSTLPTLLLPPVLLVIMERPPHGFTIMSDGTVVMGDDCPSLSPMMLALMAAVQTKILQKDAEAAHGQAEDGSEDEDGSSMKSEEDPAMTDEADKEKGKGKTNEAASSSTAPNPSTMTSSSLQRPQTKKSKKSKRSNKANFYKKK